MPNFRTSAILCGGAFCLLILTAVSGNLMPEAARSLPLIRLLLQALFFGSLAVFLIAAVPLMVNAVFQAQVSLRGQKTSSRAAIVWALWTFLALGTLVAIPAAIAFGAFGDVQGTLLERYTARSQGRLVAGIGMSVPQMRRASTLVLAGDAGYTTTIAKPAVFDFQISGTPTIFRGCRLYYMTIDAAKLVDTVHISIVPAQMSVTELERFQAATRARLHAEGWRQLSTPDDFSRGDTWLYLGRARVDDYQSGEAEGAGEWIATIDLASLRTYKRRPAR